MQGWEFCEISNQVVSKKTARIEVFLQTLGGRKLILYSETFKSSDYGSADNEEDYINRWSAIVTQLGIDGWIPVPQGQSYRPHFFRRQIP